MKDKDFVKIPNEDHFIEVSPHLYRTNGILFCTTLEQAREYVQKINEHLDSTGEEAYRINTTAIDLSLRKLGPEHAIFEDNRLLRRPENIPYAEWLDNTLCIPEHLGKTYRESRMKNGCKQVLRIVKENGIPVAEEWVAEGGFAIEYTTHGIPTLVAPSREKHGFTCRVHWFFNEGQNEVAIRRTRIICHGDQGSSGEGEDYRVFYGHSTVCFGLTAADTLTSYPTGFRLVRESRE